MKLMKTLGALCLCAAMTVTQVPLVSYAAVTTLILDGDISDELVDAGYDELMLMSDATVSTGDAVTVEAGRTVTVNLNGYNLTNERGMIVAEGGSLTIKGAGTVTNNGTYGISVSSGGRFTLSGSTLSGGTSTVIANSGNTLVEGGNVTVASGTGTAVSNSNGATFEVSGGTVENTSGTAITNAGSSSNRGTVKVSGGSVSGSGVGILCEGGRVTVTDGSVTGGNAGISLQSGTNSVYSVANITDGTVKSTSSSNGTAAVIIGADTSTISIKNEANISGGTLSGRYGVLVGNTGVLNVSGGRIDGSAAGIYQPRNGKTTVSGGTISSEGTGIELKAGEAEISDATVSSSVSTPSCTSSTSGSDTRGYAVVLVKNPSYGTNTANTIDIESGYFKGSVGIAGSTGTSGGYTVNIDGGYYDHKDMVTNGATLASGKIIAANSDGDSSAYPFVVSTGSSGSTSTDATLRSIGGKTVKTTGSGTTPEAPEGLSLSVSNSVSSISATNILPTSSYASVAFFGTDSSFTTSTTTAVNVNAGSEATVYARVTAQDTSVVAYYSITVYRMSSSGSSSTDDSTGSGSSGNQKDSETEYRIYVSSSGRGYIDCEKSRSREGEMVTLTVVADEGYKVYEVKVEGDDDDEKITVRHTSANLYVFLMPDERVNVSAVFVRADEEIEDNSSYNWGGAATSYGSVFSDVNYSDWFYSPVNYVNSMKLMTGTSYNTFEPNAPTTRAMVVTVLYRLSGTPAVSGYTGYSDVQAGAYYESAVNWASSKGIVNGWGDGTFHPNDVVSRADLATFLYRYAALSGKDVSNNANLSGYNDSQYVAAYARYPMGWAVSRGIMNGVGGSRLSPLGGATRAQVAAMLYRYINS